MDYRDNPQHRALPHAKGTDFYAAPVVYFCSGEWCVFTPALTPPSAKTESLPLADFYSGQQPDILAASVVDYCSGVLMKFGRQDCVTVKVKAAFRILC